MTEAITKTPIESKDGKEKNLPVIERARKAIDPMDYYPPQGAPLELFPIRRIGEIPVEPCRWLGYEFLEEGTMGTLLGESGVGKSFLAIDFALSIATGKPWHGRDVTQGGVLYIAGEGRKGVIRRISGWSKHHQIDLSEIPLFIPDFSINLSDREGMKIVFQALKEIVKQIEQLKLIIIDTWSTCLGADENSTNETMKGLSTLRSLAAPYGSAVLIVHHVGHGSKHRPRGSTAFPASLDMVHIIEKGRNGTIHMISPKAKDSATPSTMDFKLLPIGIGIENDKGEEETTAVIIDAEADTMKEGKVAASGSRQVVAMSCLHTLMSELRKEEITPEKVSIDEWRNAFMEKVGPGSSRAFTQTKKTLIDTGRVIVEGDHVSLP